MKQSGTWWTLGLILVAAACLGAWLIGGPRPGEDEPTMGTIVEMPEAAQPTVVQAEMVKPSEAPKHVGAD